jgi:hypothetical protein
VARAENSLVTRLLADLLVAAGILLLAVVVWRLIFP